MLLIKKRIEEDAKVIRELYLDKVKGILSENDFLNLSKDFTNDRERLEKLVIERKKQLDVIERKSRQAIIAASLLSNTQILNI